MMDPYFPAGSKRVSSSSAGMIFRPLTRSRPQAEKKPGRVTQEEKTSHRLFFRSGCRLINADSEDLRITSNPRSTGLTSAVVAAGGNRSAAARNRFQPLRKQKTRKVA